MEVVPPLQLQQPPHFWEGFPEDFKVWLWEFVPIRSKQILGGQVVILDKKTWFTIKSFNLF